VKRTQIYLDEETFEYLKAESSLRGVTISEIIRESIRGKRHQSTEKILSALDDVAGVWKNRKFDIEKYVRGLRRDRTI